MSIIIAVLVGLYNATWAQHEDKGWVSVAFLFIYMLAFGMTWGPVRTLILLDILKI